MSDPLIRELDHYVVLEPGKPEQLLSVAETLAWLEQQLSSLESIPEAVGLGHYGRSGAALAGDGL